MPATNRLPRAQYHRVEAAQLARNIPADPVSIETDDSAPFFDFRPEPAYVPPPAPVYASRIDEIFARLGGDDGITLIAVEGFIAFCVESARFDRRMASEYPAGSASRAVFVKSAEEYEADADAVRVETAKRGIV